MNNDELIEKVRLQEIKKINYWLVTTDDGCDGLKTSWRFIARGTPDNILKQILNENHKCGWGFKFTPLKYAEDFESLDLTQLKIINNIPLFSNIEINRFELSLWHNAGLNEHGDETFYHYQKELFPSMQPYLQFIDWVSSNGETSNSPMRRPGTCEYRIPKRQVNDGE